MGSRKEIPISLKEIPISFCLMILLIKQEACEKELVLKLAGCSIRPIMSVLNSNFLFFQIVNDVFIVKINTVLVMT